MSEINYRKKNPKISRVDHERLEKRVERLEKIIEELTEANNAGKENKEKYSA